MKLVTWRGNYSKMYDRCLTEIMKGDKAWRVQGGPPNGKFRRRYFCLKCGEEIQQ